MRALSTLNPAVTAVVAKGALAPAQRPPQQPQGSRQAPSFRGMVRWA
jgi:hypothetical protein